MEKNLTKFDSVVNKKMSVSHSAKEIKCVKINDEIIILKKHSSYKKYFHEKKIYQLLKEEDFLPKLKYFDDKQFLLGLTDVGESLELFKLKNENLDENLVENINTQIKIIEDKLLDNYSLYHNDLLERNICIDDKNKIRFIDLESVNSKPHPRYHKWNTPRPPPRSVAEATRDKRKKREKEKS